MCRLRETLATHAAPTHAHVRDDDAQPRSLARNCPRSGACTKSRRHVRSAHADGTRALARSCSRAGARRARSACAQRAADGIGRLLGLLGETVAPVHSACTDYFSACDASPAPSRSCHPYPRPTRQPRCAALRGCSQARGMAHSVGEGALRRVRAMPRRRPQRARRRAAEVRAVPDGNLSPEPRGRCAPARGARRNAASHASHTSGARRTNIALHRARAAPVAGAVNDGFGRAGA